jgi:hypothetical protein
MLEAQSTIEAAKQATALGGNDETLRVSRTYSDCNSASALRNTRWENADIRLRTARYEKRSAGHNHKTRKLSAARHHPQTA